MGSHMCLSLIWEIEWLVLLLEGRKSCALVSEISPELIQQKFVYLERKMTMK